MSFTACLILKNASATNIQVLYFVRNLRTRPTHNLTLIDRVNKLMTNNIRSTYNSHTFFGVTRTSPSKNIYIGLIYVVILTLYPNIGLIWCILTPYPNRVKKLIFNIKRLIGLTLVSPIVFVIVT